MSGTNVHLLLEEAPAAGADENERAGGPLLAGGPLPWVMSGRSAEGLRGQAGRLAAHLAARPDLDPADVGWSLATARSSFEHRTVITGADRDELTAGLTALAAGETAPGLVTGTAPSGGGVRVGFLFAGQGSQRAGMGAALHATSPVFAAAFDRACALLEAELGVPVAEVVLGGDADDRADQTLYAQPGLFAVQAGLVALLAAAGITPDAVAGHSVGEVAAAHAAGVLSLEDACRLVATRARLMQALPGGGAMTAIAATEAEVAAALDGVAGISIAAVNGPSSVVVSGDADAVGEAAELFRARGVRVKALRVSHAFHSHRMDPVLGELGQVAAGLEFDTPRVPWAGALTGELVTNCEPGYWVAQARQPVRFAAAVAALAAQQVSVFIEIGPDGTLSALGGEGSDALFIPLLRPGQDAPAAVTAALARAHVAGAGVDWAAVLGHGQRVDLPTYAFQHQRYWPQARHVIAPAGGDGAGTAAEARFWAAVEGGDLQALAQTLTVDGQRPFGEVLPELAAWRRRERDRTATEGWRYRVSWAPVPDADHTALSGTWLMVTPAGIGRDLADGCRRALEAHGAGVVVAETATDDTERSRLTALITALPVAPGDVRGVISLLALDEGPVPGHPVVARGLAGTLGLVQALGDAGVDAPLWVLTAGAVAADPGEVLASPVQQQVWGLGRVAAAEHRDRWGGLIDMPGVPDERAGARLCAVLAGRGEDQVAIRGAGVFARRLVRAPLAGSGRAWTPGGSVLVTGGTGAIGGHVAKWLAGAGAPRVVLTSRSGPDGRSVAGLAAQLAAAGTATEVMACDHADRAQTAGLLARIAARGPRLSAVLHAAGVLDDGVLDGLDAGRLGTVLTAKAAGAAHLDELTRDLDLDQFVLFSSAAATFGGAGQGNYAAANAFLDGLAQRRAGLGLAALSVAWGPWAGGMAQASAAVRARMRRGPLPEMDPGLAIKALAQALDGRDSLLAVMDVDWAQFATTPGPFIRDLPDVTQLARETTADGGKQELTQQLAGLPKARQIQVLADLVRAGAAAVLGHASTDSIAADRAFGDLGFDSLTSLEMRQHLAAATGLKLSATLLFDYPTPVQLAEYLWAEAFAAQSGHRPVLDELDRLAALLSSIARNDANRSDITARLEAITQEFRAEPAKDAAAEYELQTATNDEMFDLVEQELRDSDFD
jgi:acyl transferase domain-containing protein